MERLLLELKCGQESTQESPQMAAAKSENLTYARSEGSFIWELLGVLEEATAPQINLGSAAEYPYSTKWTCKHHSFDQVVTLSFVGSSWSWRPRAFPTMPSWPVSQAALRLSSYNPWLLFLEISSLHISGPRSCRTILSSFRPLPVEIQKSCQSCRSVQLENQQMFLWSSSACWRWSDSKDWPIRFALLKHVWNMLNHVEAQSCERRNGSRLQRNQRLWNKFRLNVVVRSCWHRHWKLQVHCCRHLLCGSVNLLALRKCSRFEGPQRRTSRWSLFSQEKVPSSQLQSLEAWRSLIGRPFFNLPMACLRRWALYNCQRPWIYFYLFILCVLPYFHNICFSGPPGPAKLSTKSSAGWPRSFLRSLSIKAMSRFLQMIGRPLPLLEWTAFCEFCESRLASRFRLAYWPSRTAKQNPSSRSTAICQHQGVWKQCHLYRK